MKSSIREIINTLFLAWLGLKIYHLIFFLAVILTAVLVTCYKHIMHMTGGGGIILILIAIFLLLATALQERAATKRKH